MNPTGEIALSIETLARQVKPGCAYIKIQLEALDWGFIQAVTGFDLSDFYVIVDTHAMQHTLKKHGTKAESLRGQKEIQRLDFEKLPLLLSSPSAIMPLGLNRIGRECLGFEKSFMGYKFRAVMEIRTGRKEFALVSLYTVGKLSESLSD